MQPKIIEKESFFVLGYQGVFTSDTVPEIPGLWSRLMKDTDKIKNIVGTHSFGLEQCYNEADQSFSYMACYEVSDLSSIPDGMTGLEVTAQKYAVFTIHIAEPNLQRDIQRAFDYIWNDWIPNSEYEFAGAPNFEYYDDRFALDTMSGEIDIYMPIK